MGKLDKIFSALLQLLDSVQLLTTQLKSNASNKNPQEALQVLQGLRKSTKVCLWN
jgi:hypothetical protein